MKKLILGIAIFTFVLFGVAGVQTVFADSNSNVVELLDKDPKKDNDKKDKKECKDASRAKSDCKEYKSGKCCDKAQMKSDCKKDSKAVKKSDDPDKI